MNLAYGGQKFRSTAFYHKQIESSDGEQLRPSVKGSAFRCCDYEQQKVNRMIVAEGVVAKTATLAIITDYAGAKEFEPDDIITYQNHDRRVLWVGKVKNYSTPNSVAFVIGLV